MRRINRVVHNHAQQIDFTRAEVKLRLVSVCAAIFRDDLLRILHDDINQCEGNLTTRGLSSRVLRKPVVHF